MLQYSVCKVYLLVQVKENLYAFFKRGGCNYMMYVRHLCGPLLASMHCDLEVLWVVATQWVFQVRYNTDLRSIT